MTKALLALVVISCPVAALDKEGRAEPDAMPAVVAKLFDCYAIEESNFSSGDFCAASAATLAS